MPPVGIREFPTGWVGAPDSPCRPEKIPVPLSPSQSRAGLVDYPVTWKDLRLYVRLLMEDRLENPYALALAGEDKCLHVSFHLNALTVMLLSMMRGQRLDSTPWTKYVPRRYLNVASVAVEGLMEAGEDIPDWRVTPGSTPDVAEFELLDDEEVEDEVEKDEDYNPQQDSDNGEDNEDEDLGEASADGASTPKKVKSTKPPKAKAKVKSEDKCKSGSGSKSGNKSKSRSGLQKLPLDLGDLLYPVARLELLITLEPEKLVLKLHDRSGAIVRCESTLDPVVLGGHLPVKGQRSEGSESQLPSIKLGQNVCQFALDSEVLELSRQFASSQWGLARRQDEIPDDITVIEEVIQGSQLSGPQALCLDDRFQTTKAVLEERISVVVALRRRNANNPDGSVRCLARWNVTTTGR
ncbi:unnamed protein product [Phytophthora fragariaefolia]|uniref:Unnamed protein product n=1 Tax=Phytophthora fragariaefolia TaxID=1490495 RepID=A0A9W6XX44_9STRA|nr:unnamed protein product [Phytophthora fragariaefolia]